MPNSSASFWVFLIVVLIIVAAVRANGGERAAKRSVTGAREPSGATHNTNALATRVDGARDVPVQRPDWEDVLPLYSLRTRFFNSAEGRFYRALLRAASDRYFVFAKVRLLDLCAFIPGRDYSAMNRISMKHVDFLLCHPATLRPLVAFEVDGPSHLRADRVERDAFVDALFKQIGVPLIHVPVAPWFEPTDVSRRIEAAIGAGANRSSLVSQSA